MKLLLASSEVHPYSKTGGLADMVGALAKSLARAGHEIYLVTPLYAGIREKFPQVELTTLKLDLPVGDRHVQGRVWKTSSIEGLTIYFIDQPEFFYRHSPYLQPDGISYPDNDERFIFYSKAIAHLALHAFKNLDVVHVHDWQAGLVPLLMRHEVLSRHKKTAGQGRVPPTCLTIHNLAYQGTFPAWRYTLTNLPWNYFNIDGVEFYGQMNCLKAGIVFSDIVTTVSPRYAREITTQEYGCGLEGLLLERQKDLVGILNGVDYDEWNTTNNPYLHHPYSSEDLAGKTANKLDLQSELGLPMDATIPLFGSVTRLADQKGVDIQLGALEEMLSTNIQFVLLGSGSGAFEASYRDLEIRYPGKVAIRIGFNQGLSHRIEAGSDFFLMPSRFEPCGLNQMYSLRYGTIPIVRATGGLDDSVIDISEDADRANGIKFGEYSNQALAKGMRKALALYGEPELLQHYRLNATAADFSWHRTAQQYTQVYETLLKAGQTTTQMK